MYYISQKVIFFFGLELLNWCQKINKMYNMMKKGRVAVCDVYNTHFDFKFPYDAHFWLEKYVVRAFFFFIIQFDVRTQIQLANGRALKSIFSHLVLYKNTVS